tara:strand:+ start:1737 stop:2006 length:270 start_codon:yes stop_codon:yes gene_type:complete
MAKCEHGHEPSNQCGICIKERNYMQFGGIWSGEVGLKYKEKPTTKLGLSEAMEERANDYDPEKQNEAMKEFVLKSFTTEVEVPKVKGDE